MARRVWRWFGLSARLLRDTRGVIALKFALAIPAVSILALGGVDLLAVHSDRQRLQDIADAAALAGARELAMAVDDVGPEQRALAHIESLLADWSHRPTVTPSVEVITAGSGDRALRVALHGNRMSFFGNLLPPGGWNMNTEAIASSVAMVPLCVMAHGEGKGDALQLFDSAIMDAPTCLVHSNDRLKAGMFSRINAGIIQSVGASSGNLRPGPQEGAMVIEDPYRALDASPPGSCSARQVVEIQRHTTLAAGLHCDDYVVTGSAQLRLSPGEHYFVDSRLELQDTSRLTGDNVVLVFDHAAFDFLDRSRVTLSGRQDGFLAGFVIIGLRPPEGWCPAGEEEEEDDEEEDDEEEGGAEPSRPDDCHLGSEFVMASDNVERLDGVIYTPASRLIVRGSNQIAERSDWTVMIVETLEIRGSPTLVINADYAGSDIPVPPGVGPNSGAARLIR